MMKFDRISGSIEKYSGHLTKNHILHHEDKFSLPTYCTSFHIASHYYAYVHLECVLIVDYNFIVIFQSCGLNL